MSLLRPRGRGEERGRWLGPPARGLTKETAPLSLVTVCSAGNAPGGGGGGRWSGLPKQILAFPANSWQQEASLSILQHYSQLYSQTRCPEQLGVMVSGAQQAGGGCPGSPAPSLQEGAAIHRDAPAPGIRTTPPKKGARTLHPEGSRGRSHNESSPAGENRGCGW